LTVTRLSDHKTLSRFINSASDAKYRVKPPACQYLQVIDAFGAFPAMSSSRTARAPELSAECKRNHRLCSVDEHTAMPVDIRTFISAFSLQ
jgi:hypothetical protein